MSKLKQKILYRGQYYNPNHFYNRDLSWLDFNSRVLQQSTQKQTPLLERLKFIDIYRSNNDEFYMKRVGRLINKIQSQANDLSLDGQAADTLYKSIHSKVEKQWKKIISNYRTSVLPALNRCGIKFVAWSELSNVEKNNVKKYFTKNIFPILTPLAVDEGHPFPFLSNLSKSIAIKLKRPNKNEYVFARVKIPSESEQWVRLKKQAKYPERFISIDDIILNNLEMLFPGMIVESKSIFRVTRNAAMDDSVDEEIDDVVTWVEEELHDRKFAPIVRLEIMQGVDSWILDYLKAELNLKNNMIFKINSHLHYTNFSQIYKLNFPLLQYKPVKHNKVNDFKDIEGQANIFNYLSNNDALIHFPYHSYRDSVTKFLQQAANDPKVKAIKIILYRTDDDGRLIDLLIQAAKNKKQVACIIELKARFDEERNIKWAQELERYGVHVSYGSKDTKTHAKMILVVRKERGRLKTYFNIGTGNFNSQTSKLYTDMSYFSSDQKIGLEVLQVFNYLTGASMPLKYKSLLVAPFNMKPKFLNMIQQEIKNKKLGKPTGIIAKCNSLEDPEIIEKLYEASQAGVSIQLIIRGFCCLKPGIPGLSKNIQVISLVGQFLEHSRIFYFRSGMKDPNNGKTFIGSADWMHRNLSERNEVILPITHKQHRSTIYKSLKMILQDKSYTWELDSEGVYKKRQKTGKYFNSQQEFFNIFE